LKFQLPILVLNFFPFLLAEKPVPLRFSMAIPFPSNFARLNNVFTDGVINNSAKCWFLPGKPFQNTLRILRAFGLKRTPDFLSFFSIFCKLSRVKRFSIAKSGYFNDAHIHSNKLLNIFKVFFRNIYSLTQEKFTFLKYQIRLTLHVGQIVPIIAYKWYFQPAADSPNRNRIIGVVRKYPLYHRK
jgi:hypothetical protein